MNKSLLSKACYTIMHHTHHLSFIFVSFYPVKISTSPHRFLPALPPSCVLPPLTCTSCPAASAAPPLPGS